MIKRFVYIVSLLVCCLSVQAQVVFECDFEDANERAQWVLNDCANEDVKGRLINFWNIGKAGHFAPTGENGLFIGTSENATESAYSASTSIVNVAYRNLPHLNAGKYTISFDWLFNGKSGKEGLYACLVPKDVKTMSGGTALTMAWFKSYALPLSMDTVLHNTSTWDVCTLTCTIPEGVEGDYKLVILFYSVKGAVNGPSAAIDNISIFYADQCAAPMDISHTISGKDVNLKWKGNADSYDIRTYSYETGKWQEFNTDTLSFLVPNVEEGIGIFYLRSRCGDKTSEWVKYEKFIFHKGVRCIDYMDLNKNNCAYGTFASPAGQKGVIDYGYAEKESRHTLHYVPNEVDPRTMEEGDPSKGLRTKPEGALASVRLGNWNIGAEAEQITYTHKVDDGHNAILKLQYAVVMEDPAHDASAQPKFTLSILHNGKKLPGDCGEANFVSGGNLDERDGWHIAFGGATPVYWKEWTTVSINLRDYMGETITIKLTTYDCSQSGHYGYAYFVLGCESGEMSDLNCGEDNPTTTFTAPEGFDYEWYKKSDSTQKVLGTKQQFTIDPMDTAIYVVRVISKTNGQCYYELDACGMPRIPKPMLTYDVRAERCENVVTFYNHSYVELQNMFDNTRTKSKESVTDLTWDFGDGEQVTLMQDTMVHIYPREGGTYRMGLTAYVSGHKCYETKYYDLVLPDLTTDTTLVEEQLCRKEWPFGYGYDGQFFKNDLDTNFTFISKKTGCDSIVHLVLKWHNGVPDWDYPEIGYKDTATICEGYTYVFGKDSLTEQGVYRDTFPDWAGCDSIVDLMLYVVPKLRVRHEDSIMVCLAPEQTIRLLEIPYVVDTGFLDSVELHFNPAVLRYGLDTVYVFDSGQAVVIEVPDEIPPTRFDGVLTFHSPSCPIPDSYMVFEIGIPTTAIKVKDGLMAIMNSEYNGNYTFIGYQWYRDGQLIIGSEQSYIALTEDDIGHTFTLVAICPPDGLRITSCPIVYVPPTDIVEVKPTDWVTVYNTLGQKVLSTYMNQLPSLSNGIYIITNGNHATKTVY